MKWPSSWSEMTVGQAAAIIPTTGKKIPQSEYLEQGLFPIIDQGKSSAGGFTNDEGKLIPCAPPVVTFGDHTKAVRLVTRPFAPGADGLKVLKPYEFFEARVFKYFLDHLAGTIQLKRYYFHKSRS